MMLCYCEKAMRRNYYHSDLLAEAGHSCCHTKTRTAQLRNEYNKIEKRNKLVAAIVMTTSNPLLDSSVKINLYLKLHELE